MPQSNSSDDRRRWVEFVAGSSNRIILSAQETEDAKALLSDIHRDLDQLDLEIARTQAILDGSKAQRGATVARADKIRSTLTPLRRLPSELLLEIFLHSVDGHPLVLSIQPQINRSWPWPLRSVCSHWRGVAVSSSQLWNNVSVRLGKWDRLLYDRLVYAISHISSLTAHSRGLGKLEINVPCLVTIGTRESPFNLLRRFLPSLQEVSPSFHELYADDFKEKISKQFLSAAPNLQKLRIKCTGTLQLSNAPGIPWAQLRDLDLSGTFQEVKSAIYILRQCPSLEICALSIEDRPAAPGFEQLILPTLRSITMFQTVNPDNFLKHVTIPSLTELCLDTVVFSSFTEILPFLHRSGAALRVFKYIPFNDYWVERRVVEGLEDFLAENPSLVEIDCYMQFQWSLLERVLLREVLPCLESWKCNLRLDTVDLFMEAVEDQLLKTGASCALREACGRVPIHIGLLKDTLPGPMKQMKEIRERFGENFKLMDLNYDIYV